MNVNKFGHHVHKKIKMDNTSLENIFDAQHKIIKHLGAPIDPNDCATKLYVDKIIDEKFSRLKLVEQTLVQLYSEINSLKKSIECVSRKLKK